MNWHTHYCVHENRHGRWYVQYTSTGRFQARFHPKWIDRTGDIPDPIVLGDSTTPEYLLQSLCLGETRWPNGLNPATCDLPPTYDDWEVVTHWVAPKDGP